MDEARLAEIEEAFEHLALDQDMPNAEWEALQLEVLKAQHELIAEVRRLRALSQSNDRAYSDGIDSGHADIVGIIQDPLEFDDPAGILEEIKRFLGMD